MSLFVLIGLLGAARAGLAAHYCAIVWAVFRIATGLISGSPLGPLLVVATVASVIAYFWFRLLEAFEETIFTYLCVAVFGIVALSML